MTDPDIEERAKELWDDQQTVKPDWDQLSETTKDAWRERAIDGVSPEGWPPLTRKR